MTALIQRIERMQRDLRTGKAAVTEVAALLEEVAAALGGAGDSRDGVARALRSMSYSEREAIVHLVDSLPDETGGAIVSARVADSAGVTRSIVVSALRKLESAGVLQARSMGMKGTMIRLLGGLKAYELRRQIEADAGVVA